MVLRIFLLAVAFSLMVSYAGAQGKIRGTYEVLGKLPPKNSMDKVVFEEFINFACPHCNNFRLLSREMKERYKDLVEFVDVPILFRGAGRCAIALVLCRQVYGKGRGGEKCNF